MGIKCSEFFYKSILSQCFCNVTKANYFVKLNKHLYESKYILYGIDIVERDHL